MPLPAEGSDAGEELGPFEIAGRPKAGVHQGDGAYDRIGWKATIPHSQPCYGCRVVVRGTVIQGQVFSGRCDMVRHPARKGPGAQRVLLNQHEEC